MSVWSCQKKEECPVLKSTFCGDEREGPIVLSYHPTSADAVMECYVDHIISCWNKWLELKDKWLHSVKRVVECATGDRFNKDIFQQTMSFMILHHDIGKLTVEYQKREFFRHEVVSSYILYRYLQEHIPKSLATILAAATYLHHEGLQITHEHFEMREPTYSYLLAWLSSREFHMINGWEDLMFHVTQKYLPEFMPFSACHLRAIRGSEIADVLGSIAIRVDGCSAPLSMRMAIAAVLHPLTICDSLAAKKRGGTSSFFSEDITRLFNLGALPMVQE